jgi:hypothetical protein
LCMTQCPCQTRRINLEQWFIPFPRKKHPFSHGPTEREDDLVMWHLRFIKCFSCSAWSDLNGEIRGRIMRLSVEIVSSRGVYYVRKSIADSWWIRWKHSIWNLQASYSPCHRYGAFTEASSRHILRWMIAQLWLTIEATKKRLGQLHLILRCLKP